MYIYTLGETFLVYFVVPFIEKYSLGITTLNHFKIQKAITILTKYSNLHI